MKSILNLDCGLGWELFEDHCYKYFGSDREKFTWQEAKEECLKQKAHLVSIHSEDEHRFIQTIIPTYDSFSQFFPWIGAKYTQNTNTVLQKKVSSTKPKSIETQPMEGWEWEDQSDVDYWDEHYSPSGSDLSNHCIAINNWAFGLWVDTDCNSGHNFVCKRKSL